MIITPYVKVGRIFKREDTALKFNKIDAGRDTLEEKRFLFRTRKKHVLTEKGKELENNIYKFVNYLHDFSLLNEHEAVNVKIWDSLMIWAGLLGLTKVVYKEFKKLYPYYDTESIYKEKGIHTANIYSRTASRATTSSSNSGGGGSSSSGGGGGSFGGGSGGGTR